MTESCPNCGQDIQLNFCPNCGQKKVKRIDRDYIKDELQYTMLHMNKGLPYTLKHLLKDPGGTARNFVIGNRVNHYKPILLVFLLSGIVAFLTNTLVDPSPIYKRYVEMQAEKPPVDMAAINEFMMHYYSLIMLIGVLPWVALCTWFAFRKWGYNYWENIVMNAYLYSVIMVFTIVIIIPIQLLLKDSPILFIHLPAIVTMLATVAIYFWFFVGVYKDKAPGDVIVRSLAMFAVAFGFFLAIGVVMGIIAVINSKK